MTVGIRIADMPDIGAVTDACRFVGEHAGSGTFAATAVRRYIAGTTINIAKPAAGSDITAALAAAVSEATTAGCGLLLIPPGNWVISSTITIAASNIRIQGAGRGAYHDVAPYWTPGATNLTWAGANGGTMIAVAPPPGGQRIVGWAVTGLALIAGVWPFTNAAANGLTVSSSSFGEVDITTFEFSGIHVDFEAVAGLTEDANNEGNRITIIFRALSNAGTILKMGGTTGVGNSTMNELPYVGGQYYNGTVIDWAACDNNQARMVVPYRAAGGTGTAMVFRGQRTVGGEFARQNKIDWYSQQTGGGVIVVEGTNTSGVVGASVQNGIDRFDYGDDSPNIITGTGSSFWYGSDLAPPGKLFENFSIGGGGGASVSASRLADVWGTLTTVSSGSFVVSVVAFGNAPIGGIQNVQITPLQSGTDWNIDSAGFTSTSFKINVSGAGSYMWRAVVI